MTQIASIPPSIELGEALVAEIAGASLSLSPTTVERKYIPDYDREEDDSLKVFVFVTELVVTEGHRTKDSFDFNIAIGVFKAAEAKDRDLLDSLIKYVTEIIDLLRSKSDLTALPEAKRQGDLACRPLFEPDALDQQKTFVSAILGGYRLTR